MTRRNVRMKRLLEKPWFPYVLPFAHGTADHYQLRGNPVISWKAEP